MYKQIVVGTDGSDGAGIAVEAAIDLARLTGATLHVVYAHDVTTAYALAAVPGVGMPVDAINEANEATRVEAQQITALVVERAGNAGVEAIAHCVPGDAADALLSIANDTGCGSMAHTRPAGPTA